MSILAAVLPDDSSCVAVLRAAGKLAGSNTFDVLSLYPSPDSDESYSSAAERTVLAREAMKRQIEADLKSLSLTATVLVPVARLYNIGDNIAERAREAGASVVVIGTHGRTGMGRLLLGSVAERVVRHAHCDVYVVRPPQPAR